jgi:BirA family biotin operon repressor/biotin-[acetyl-CoA-carboxylase] ligase
VTPREVRRSDTRHVGRRVLLYDTLPSTNDLAAELAADPANDGVVVVADFQTAGRGQYGRAWQSRPGASLLMSVAVHPPPQAGRPVVLTAWAAVAVGDAVRELTGAEARIKWPNDLLVRDKKVCGILIEQRRGVVAGIGLNLNQTAEEFAAAGLPEAASLAMVAGTPVEPAAALGVVVRHLDDVFAQLVGGEWDALEGEWGRRFGLLGRPVVAELADGAAAAGLLRELGFDGIALDGRDGVRVLRPELVRQLRPG